MELPTIAGTYAFHKGQYGVEAKKLDAAATWQISIRSDEIIFVRDGELTLSTAAGEAIFGAGDAVVLPAGFAGKAAASSDYSALTARWFV